MVTVSIVLNMTLNTVHEEALHFKFYNKIILADKKITKILDLL